MLTIVRWDAATAAPLMLVVRSNMERCPKCKKLAISHREKKVAASNGWEVECKSCKTIFKVPLGVFAQAIALFVLPILLNFTVWPFIKELPIWSLLITFLIPAIAFREIAILILPLKEVVNYDRHETYS